MTWIRTTVSNSGHRVTIQDSTGYLVSVSGPCPAQVWCEAFRAYKAATSGTYEKVAA